MAAGTLSPTPKFTGFDNAGAIIPGGKLFTYTAGTSTKINTYTDVGLTVANSNPIILDSAGRCTIFLSPGTSYRFKLAPSTDTDPPVSPYWDQDNIAAVPTSSAAVDILGTAGGNLTAGWVVYLSDGSGGNTAGRWYAADSGNTYSSLGANALGMVPSSIANGATGSIRLIGSVSGLSGLVTGSVYYISTSGAISTTAGTYARPFCVADSSTSVIIPNQIPPTTQGTAVLYSNWTPTNSINGTTDMMSFSVPGGILARVGQCLHIHSDFFTANNANAKTLRFYWNAVQIGNDLNIGGSAVFFAVADLYIGKTGSSTQQISGYLQEGKAGSFPGVAAGEPVSTTGAGTDTGAIVTKFVTVSGAAADIIQTNMTVELLSV